MFGLNLTLKFGSGLQCLDVFEDGDYKVCVVVAGWVCGGV